MALLDLPSAIRGLAAIALPVLQAFGRRFERGGVCGGRRQSQDDGGKFQSMMTVEVALQGDAFALIAVALATGSGEADLSEQRTASP